MSIIFPLAVVVCFGFILFGAYFTMVNKAFGEQDDD